MSARTRAAIGLGAALALALGGLAMDANGRRARLAGSGDTLASIVEATGTVDLALSSGARWLRHPTSAEPAAGCASPTCLDIDPGGLALPPPRETFGRSTGPTLFRVPEAP